MNTTVRFRSPEVGRPLIAGMALISGWVAIRAGTWEPPFPMPSADGLFAQAKVGERVARFDSDRDAMIEFEPEARPFVPLRDAAPAQYITAMLAGSSASSSAGTRPSVPGFANPLGVSLVSRAGLSTNHQLLFASALSYAAGEQAIATSRVAKPDAMVAGRGRPGSPGSWLTAQIDGPPAGTMAVQDAEPAPRPDRWSGDAWLLLREGGGNPLLASVNPASYGSDQAGAVARYALEPNSRLDPHIYTRASKALVSGGESEIAAGGSISLARSFPLRVHGEVRVTDRPGATEVRPAAFVVTGVPRREIVQGIEADAYLQAGYVGGDFETGFVDGKATLEAPVIHGDTAKVTIGGGVWGGAQRDASRLDAGPTASVILSTGKATLRASIDYRVRVAGDANPGDGVAVTLAASF